MEYQLIALDMDGTLLDGDGHIPDGFWPILRELKTRGVAVAPASGRQLATLRDMFAGEDDPGTYIAENGTCVFHDGRVVSTTELDQADVHAIIDAAGDFDIVVCTPTVAYISPNLSAPSFAEIIKYYHSHEVVEDLHQIVDRGVIKVAVYTDDDAEAVAYPVVRDAAPDANVVVSGAHWIDVMHPSAGKGRALTDLAQALDIPIARTLAFGDYLNDYELLDAAGTSYAMANAHPDIKALADHIAPPNTEAGVVTVLEDMLGP